MAGESDADIDTFSYADPTAPRQKKLFIRIVERMTGQPYLKWLYEENRANPVQGEDFLDAAVRMLELHVKYNAVALAHWPMTGPRGGGAGRPGGGRDGRL